LFYGPVNNGIYPWPLRKSGKEGPTLHSQTG
jgi:hypothetical protein